jgi:ABC-type sugar transport system ATPase subunit
MTAALSIDRLIKRYASVTPAVDKAGGQPPPAKALAVSTTGAALTELSLEASKGELLTVVGPSGCGKSTLLRLLAGLEEETSGEMHLEGQRLNGLPPGKRDIALMFQNYALFPHLKVGDNMAFGLRVRGASKAAAFAEVGQVAERLGIAHLLDRMPHQVSGGERQRAALGRALLRRPKLFLFDEPLSSLDAALRANLRVEIGRLHRELGATMLFVTHDQSEALTLGTRVAVLNQGVLQQIADPDTLYREPANRFVAGFIGNPGMNFFEGELVHASGAGHAQDATWMFRHTDLTSHLVLPAALTASLPKLKPGKVTLGLRPEAIGLAAATEAASADYNSQNPCGLRGRINLVERHGGAFTAYLHGASAAFVAKYDGLQVQREARIPASGADLTLWPDWSQSRFFDAESGKSLH